MKNNILLTILVLGMRMTMNAQSDGFFTYHYECRENNNDEWSELILLPKTHGLDYNYPADSAPIGTGLLLMAGMGMVYAIHRKKK